MFTGPVWESLCYGTRQIFWGLSFTCFIVYESLIFKNNIRVLRLSKSLGILIKKCVVDIAFSKNTLLKSIDFEIAHL